MRITFANARNRYYYVDPIYTLCTCLSVRFEEKKVSEQSLWIKTRKHMKNGTSQAFTLRGRNSKLLNLALNVVRLWSDYYNPLTLHLVLRVVSCYKGYNQVTTSEVRSVIKLLPCGSLCYRPMYYTYHSARWHSHWTGSLTKTNHAAAVSTDQTTVPKCHYLFSTKCVKFL